MYTTLDVFVFITPPIIRDPFIAKLPVSSIYVHTIIRMNCSGIKFLSIRYNTIDICHNNIRGFKVHAIIELTSKMALNNNK